MGTYPINAVNMLPSGRAIALHKVMRYDKYLPFKRR